MKTAGFHLILISSVLWDQTIFDLQSKQAQERENMKPRQVNNKRGYSKICCP